MKACASVGRREREKAGWEDRAIVLIEGRPMPELQVVEYRMEGALDRRRVWVEGAGRADVGRWLGRQAVVAWPVRLVDDSVRWPVLVQGVLSSAECGEARGFVERGLEIMDHWGELLGRPLAVVWRVEEGRLKALPASGSGRLMRIGGQANRSADRWQVHGRRVHVLEMGGDGESWTVRTALESLSAWGKLELGLELLPAEIGEAPLVREIDLSEPVGRCLEKILGDYGLCIQRDIRREGALVLERRVVRPVERGRLVRLGWPEGAVLRIESEQLATSAEQWIARADGWMVEGTFSLVRAWDRSLEGLADWIYSRAANPDFAPYANVYRRWALNEDGRYSGGVFGDQRVFDLSRFFGDSTVGREPVAFEDCLTLDANGWPRRPIVEVSTDGGSNWSVYEGQIELEKGRAEVCLADATLPTGFLTAAKNGLARVRVTASLRSPRLVQISRWMGNPFEPITGQRVLNAGKAFSFRRVHESSVHYCLVRSGQCRADEADDRMAMEKWLVDHVRRARWTGNSGGGRARLIMNRCWPLLRAGDRVRWGGGGGLGEEESGSTLPEKIRRWGAVVQEVVCRWSSLIPRRGREAGPQTVVELTF